MIERSELLELEKGLSNRHYALTRMAELAERIRLLQWIMDNNPSSESTLKCQVEHRKCCQEYDEMHELWLKSY